MPRSKMGDAMEASRELGNYITARYQTLGYLQKDFAQRLKMTPVTLRSRLKDPKKFTIHQIDDICVIIKPSAEYETRLRGVTEKTEGIRLKENAV